MYFAQKIDNGVSITYCTDTVLNEQGEKVPVKLPKGAVKIDLAKLPDRSMRDAWVLQKGKVVIDKAKGKALANGARRTEILQELDALDLKAIRPLMDGDTARLAQINEQKATLRAELAGL